MSSPFQCSDSAKTSEMVWKSKKKSQRNKSWWPRGDFNLANEFNAIERSDMSKHKQIAGYLSHITFNWDKKENHSNACCDFKGGVPVGNSYSVAREDILEVPQDCVLCTYHPMFFQKMKKRFLAWSTKNEVP